MTLIKSLIHTKDCTGQNTNQSYFNTCVEELCTYLLELLKSFENNHLSIVIFMFTMFMFITDSSK